MPAVLSKQARFVDESKWLANVAHIDDLQNALVDIEHCDNPDGFKAVTELLVMYIEQQMGLHICVQQQSWVIVV